MLFPTTFFSASEKIGMGLKYCFLSDNVYQEPFVFSVLCFQINNIILILWPNNAISRVNWIFGNLLLENILCFFMTIL